MARQTRQKGSKNLTLQELYELYKDNYISRVIDRDRAGFEEMFSYRAFVGEFRNAQKLRQKGKKYKGYSNVSLAKKLVSDQNLFKGKRGRAFAKKGYKTYTEKHKGEEVLSLKEYLGSTGKEARQDTYADYIATYIAADILKNIDSYPEFSGKTEDEIYHEIFALIKSGSYDSKLKSLVDYYRDEFERVIY